MSRAKRKFDIDPNASDPDDLDFDATERAPPQRRRNNRATPGSKKRGPKRSRRAYGGSDVDDDDEIVSDDSFTDRSESEEPEVNPQTGRSVRKVAKKAIKYEESEDEIEDTPSESDDDDTKPVSSRRRAQPSIEEVEKPSLIVHLKMSDNIRRALRQRTGSKSIAREKTPEPVGTRRSTRLRSLDVEQIALSDSGRHAIRQPTKTPEPASTRATRGGKGPRIQHQSPIVEASQEMSMIRDEDSDGPLDALLAGAEEQLQVHAEATPEQDVQALKNDEDDEGQEGVIQESQHDEDAPGESEEEEEGPVTRGGRNLRVCVGCIFHA